MSKTQCICCPVEVRNLHACAHNLLNLFKGDQDRLQCKLNEKLRGLQDAVDTLQPLMDQHFAEDHAGTRLMQERQMIDGFPRRCRVDLATPAEVAIRNAIAAVEAAGGSVALTDAVVLLGRALDRVADHVERS